MAGPVKYRPHWPLSRREMAPRTTTIKPCPHCRRKVRLLPNSATVTFLRQCGQGLSRQCGRCFRRAVHDHAAQGLSVNFLLLFFETPLETGKERGKIKATKRLV